LLGVFEIAAAVLLAVKPWWPKVSIFGSLLAIALFVATISFMFTTPGVFEASQGGFPALSLNGGFLMKDIALLGISVWTLADALRANPQHSRRFLTGLRRVVMRNWRCDNDVNEADRRHRHR